METGVFVEECDIVWLKKNIKGSNRHFDHFYQWRSPFIHLYYIKGNTNADLKASLFVCVHMKTYPENFAFSILRILELFASEVCKILKR